MKLGDFVTADPVEGVGFRQGVFVRDNGDGTMELQGLSKNGKAMLYHCKQKDAIVVPDRRLRGDLLVYAITIRGMYGFSGRE